MPQRGEFRATTDQMLEIIENLRAVEQQKRHVAVGSPEFLDAAKRAEELSRLAFRWAQMQLEMALDTQNRIGAGQIPGDVHLVDVQPRRIDRILANWREAQLRLEIAALGSPEAQAAARDIERYREEYQVAHDAVLDEAEGAPSAS
jgi:hypothetical protein